MRFHFEKLYADLVSPDGTVCVAYVTRLAFAGLSREWAGVERYAPDGSRIVQRALRAPTVVEPTADRRELHLELDLPDGRFVFHQNVRAGRWCPSGPAPSPHVRWTVEIARADARAEWTEGGQRRTLAGTGYADRVQLDRPPRWLGLSTLRWGRVHLPYATVVFNALDSTAGASWGRVLCWPESGAAREWPDVSVKGEMDWTRVAWPASSAHQALRLRTERVLHAGPALDPGRFPARTERWLTWGLSGAVSETRQLSRVEGPAGTEPGWALHETVRFGAGANPVTPHRSLQRLFFELAKDRPPSV
jgi:hypothetical protein